MTKDEIVAVLERLINSDDPRLDSICDINGEHWSPRGGYGYVVASIKKGTLGVMVETIIPNDDDCLGTEVDKFFPVSEIRSLTLRNEFE